MTATIFTWPPDYLGAALAARALLRLGVRVVLAVDAAHPLPHVEGCEAVATDFPRGGNLNGKQAVAGILGTLQKNAVGGDEWALKVDSDTLVRGLRWLEGRTEAAVGLGHPAFRSFFGCCYALRVERLPDFLTAAGRLPASGLHPEDITIGGLVEPVFTYENLTEGCPFAGYSWDRRGREFWDRFEVLVIQRTDGRSRREVADKMREMLC